MNRHCDFFVIWGMHRSGTSLLARALQVFSASLGDNLFQADSENLKGYFEDRDLIRLNDAMLADLGLRWHSLSDISETQVEILLQKGYLRQALDFLEQKAALGGSVGLKDPRMTRLLPFWRKVFAAAAITPVSLICWRDPLAVAQSLSRRALKLPFPQPVQDLRYGCLLWLSYTLASLVYTSHWPRVILNYEHLLQNPAATLQAIASRLDLQINQQELDIFCDEFVDTTLNHAPSSGSGPQIQLPQRISELHAALLSAPFLEAPHHVGAMWPDGDMDKLLAALLDTSSAKILEMAKKGQQQQADLSQLASRLEQLGRLCGLGKISGK